MFFETDGFLASTGESEHPWYITGRASGAELEIEAGPPQTTVVW